MEQMLLFFLVRQDFLEMGLQEVYFQNLRHQGVLLNLRLILRQLQQHSVLFLLRRQLIQMMLHILHRRY
jgi:hypothetical protein|tara:strand:- start:86 stop:292 length:207 start_codon:yes stop_codon:yes gene_type:complete